MSYLLQRKMIIGSFLLIPMALLIIFVFFPTLKLFQLSVTDWDGYSKTFNYTGIENFKTIFFHSKDMWISLRNNAYYFIAFTISMPFEILIASILCGNLIGKNFFKSIIFMPYVINGVAIALAFSFFFSPLGGLNTILDGLHLGELKQDWLGNIKILNFTLVFVTMWRYCGQHVVFFIAGIISIPRDQYEAAEIDGANKFQQFLYITIPGVKTIIDLLLFLNIRGVLASFEIPFLMTNGGPGYESSTFVLYSIKEAFEYSHFGLAAALGIILMLITILVYSLQSLILKGLR
ncbi:sugar ABC transporter permease [Paenibacillus sp. Soil787]|nr:sugar ABC transporter permease [Paenibacillus sp. Soil787]